MKIGKAGFSLIEILVGILIVSIVMVAAFQALSSVGIAKVKLVEKVEIEKQAYFASEKLFELIKKGGTIDYEEYWNRYSYNTTFSFGSFLNHSGFGNYGDASDIGGNTFNDSFYYCLSPNGGSMGTGGCLTANNTVGRTDQRPQLFGEYEQQFIDRNSDGDADGGLLGDEDGDGSIIGDDDDLFIGIGPEAFSGTSIKNQVGELYLVNSLGNERTYFRWKVDTATGGFIPTGAICDYSNPARPTGDACQGTIEILKLTGKDYGYNHTAVADTDGSEGDGVVDTWIIHEDFNPSATEVVAGSNSINYWQNIFPDSVNISDFELFVYPNKDLKYSWRDNNPSILVSPYIQLKYTIAPSLKVQAGIIGQKPSVDISTTIQLSSLDLQ